MSALNEVEKPRPIVNSVAHAISILQYLARQPTGAGVTMIAARLTISPSSCFNILKTLVAEDWLEFNKKTKVYRLGVGAIDLARNAIGFNDIMPTVEPLMHELAKEFHMSVALWRMHDRRRLIMIGGVESDAQTRIHLSVGQRVPLLAGAIGYCSAASLNMSEDEIREALAKTRWKDRPSHEEYMQQVELARQQGWAIDVGQWLHGLTNVGAPIVDNGGALVYGVTATMFAGQHDEQTMKAICERMGNLASYASDRLYGRENSDKAVAKAANE